MESDPKQARRVYLITFSQADRSKFPTRELFGNAITMAFNSSNKVKPTHWASCMKSHEDGKSFHHHVSLALSGPKTWLEAKRGLQEKFGVAVHFSENEGGYYSAYRYVCKLDHEVFHSDSHPNMTEAGSSGTKKAIHGYPKRRRCHAQQKIENSNLTVTNEEEPTTSKKKICRRLTVTEVSDFCIENSVKNRTQLLPAAEEQKRHGKLDLATVILNGIKKVICEIIETACEMKHADEAR